MQPVMSNGLDNYRISPSIIRSFFLQLQCKKFNAYNITDHLTVCYCRNPGRKKLSRENI